MEAEKPKKGNETLQKKLTFDPEYIKDREKIDALSRTMMGQIAQLNKRLTVIQITDFNYRLSEPAAEAQKAKTVKLKNRWLRFWGFK